MCYAADVEVGAFVEVRRAHCKKEVSLNV